MLCSFFILFSAKRAQWFVGWLGYHTACANHSALHHPFFRAWSGMQCLSHASTRASCQWRTGKNGIVCADCFTLWAASLCATPRTLALTWPHGLKCVHPARMCARVRIMPCQCCNHLNTVQATPVCLTAFLSNYDLPPARPDENYMRTNHGVDEVEEHRAEEKRLAHVVRGHWVGFDKLEAC